MPLKSTRGSLISTAGPSSVIQCQVLGIEDKQHVQTLPSRNFHVGEERDNEQVPKEANQIILDQGECLGWKTECIEIGVASREASRQWGQNSVLLSC